MKVFLRRSVMALLLGLLFSAALHATPSFSGKDLNGKMQDLSQYRGKMVVVNFWATWCPPCREELPALSLFHEDHKDKDAVVLGVNYENIGRKRLKGFLDDQLIEYPVVPMQPSQSTSLGRIVALPTSFIISPDQKQVRMHVGPLTDKALKNYLKSFRH